MNKTYQVSRLAMTVFSSVVVFIMVSFLVIHQRAKIERDDHFQFERWFSVKWPTTSDDTTTRTVAQTAVVKELLGQNNWTLTKRDKLAEVRNQISAIKVPKTPEDMQKIMDLQETATQLRTTIQENDAKLQAMCALAYKAGFAKETTLLGYTPTKF